MERGKRWFALRFELLWLQQTNVWRRRASPHTAQRGKSSTDRKYYGMKKLAATIALLCVSNAALAHDIYSGLRDRDGDLCCGGQDCKPVKAITLPNGSYYLPESGETIPANMASPSPDDRFHRCIYYPLVKLVDPWNGPVFEDKPKTRCFFAPMNSW
jgi:hypothetical protein